MKKKEYLDKVLSQIRVKSVREPLKRELSAHIDERTESYVSRGFSGAEAEERAVLDMGDPIDTGVRLDRAHRPKLPLETLIIAALLMLAGVILRRLLLTPDGLSVRAEYYHDGNEILCALTGIISAFIFCISDYTLFVRFPKISFAVYMLLFWHICDMAKFSEEYYHQIPFYGVIFAVPFMCGFVYSMRGKGRFGLALTCFLISFLPMIGCVLESCFSGMIFSLLISLVIMICAVKNGCFKVNKRKAYIMMSVTVMLGILLLLGFYIFRNMRLMSDSGRDRLFMERDHFRSIIGNAKLLGGAGSDYEFLHEAYDRQMVISVILKYGLIAGFAVSAAMLSLPLAMLFNALNVKNLFGKIISISVSFSFVFSVLWFIGSNFGITTSVQSFVSAPFIGGGVLSNAAWGALLGIYVSACARARLMPEKKLDKALRSNS